MVRTVKRTLNRYGYELARSTRSAPLEQTETEYPVDFDEETIATIRSVDGYTMTSSERLYALCHAIRYIVRHKIPGDIVECGVWRGGSMMAAARTLLSLGDTQRDLHLFDTYEGMPQPTEHDVDFAGKSVLDRWNENHTNRFNRDTRASLREVRAGMSTVGYDATKVHFVKGMVEDTIPTQAPERIALLRLDTDFYESTRHELMHLYPRLTSGGVLIIDDFGHFKGSQKAVTEYFANREEPILLHRVDYSARVAMKP